VGHASKAEIDRLNSELSVERLVEGSGVGLHRVAGVLRGLCPFHDDEGEHLVVDPKTNSWSCEACDTTGLAVDWTMKAEGVSLHHALELLRSDAPVTGTALKRDKGGRGSGVIKHATTRALPAPFETEVPDHVLLQQVVDFYQQTLKTTPEARAYLEERGVKDGTVIDRFKIGFANRTLGYRLPAKNRKAGAELRSRLQRLGILRESGHEHFRGSVVFPIFDQDGHIVQVYGRKITAGLRKGTKLHTGLPAGPRGVWNRDALSNTKEVILCEGIFDALAFWCAGFRHVTATMGVGPLGDDLRTLIQEAEVERVLIAFDRDAEGDAGAEAVATELAGFGVEIYRVVLPKGMDPAEYALEIQPASKSLEVALRQAQWMGKGKPRPRLSSRPPQPSSPAVEPTAERPTVSEPVTYEQASPAADLDERTDLSFIFGDRRWRVRGLERNTSPEVLKVNVLVSREGEGFHVDTFDMYSARHRAAFIKLAAREVVAEERVVKKDIGRLLLKLEALQDEALRKAEEERNKPVELSQQDKAAALELLRDPNLLDRILADFERCGVVGETTNKLVGYLAATSRKLDNPLAIVVQSSSAAGKTSLMDGILAFVPEEDRRKFSAMTGQSLYYLGQDNLRHRILAIAEEEGASRASYALKLLQSEGRLTIASTGKEGSTGRLVTQTYEVEGPVMIFLTTTAIDIDEELLNRCIVLTVDEGREQTRAIHAHQRAAQTLDGILARSQRAATLKVHQNAQRLLRPLAVVNPYADRLRFMDHRTRTRRDHVKYLALINAVALLHQYQREVKVVARGDEQIRYIEVEPKDIEIANRLCHEVLGRSLDELPPQTRKLLNLLDAMVTDACNRLGLDRCDYRFNRRQVREVTGWGHTQLAVHLRRLVEMEYLLAHRGGRGQTFVYELCYVAGCDDGQPVLQGLIDIGDLGASTATTPTSRGSKQETPTPSRRQTGDIPAGSRDPECPSNGDDDAVDGQPSDHAPETPRPGPEVEPRPVVDESAEG
jgi:DNA primase